MLKILPFIFLPFLGFAQNGIGTFTSVEPTLQGTDFIIPNSHAFQKIIVHGDPLHDGNNLPGKNDFTGYVPINGSSTNGYLSINSESTPGGVSILDIYFDNALKLWQTTYSAAVDFSSVAGTAKNCSGTVTPWNTIISCEETYNSLDANNDDYHDLGWCVEIDPETKTVIDKRWALGNFKHENVVIHENQRTVYQGADDQVGYLFKFVADVAQDLSSGKLYTYKGSKDGSGEWLLLNNSTPEECNTTNQQCAALEATVFKGIEDVEIGPDGLVYFAVKSENRVYRFQDSDPTTGTTVTEMETYVGNQSYEITYDDGSKLVAWGFGNDNLAFDDEGNLWVFQDGDNNYIWVVGSNHTQENPNVRIFANTPKNSEPTGITFTPDFKFMFMSIQDPTSANASSFQIDAAGDTVWFNKSTTLVISRKENFSSITDNIVAKNQLNVFPNPTFENIKIELPFQAISGILSIHNNKGQSLDSYQISNRRVAEISLANYPTGIYTIVFKDNQSNRNISARVIKY